MPSSAAPPSALPNRPARPRGSLAPEEIVDVAIGLIRSEGLGRFSMRKLAAALDVTPMTIYLRFEDKNELLVAVAERMLGRLDLPVIAEDAPWVDRAVALATAIRSHLIDSRAVLSLLGSTDGLGLAMLDATEAGLALMEDAGFTGAAAVDAFRALFWHAVGAAMVADSIAADQVGVIRRAGAPDADRLGEARVDGTHPTFHALVEHFTTPDADAIFEQTTRALATGLLSAAGRTTP